MGSEVFFGIFVVLAALLYYRINVKPKKLKAYYAQQFKDKGFKVYEFPTNLLGYPTLQILKKDSEEGDAFKTFKQLYSTYDVIISNSITSIEVVLTTPELVKQFIQHQNQFCYIKRQLLVQNLRRVVGDGITFSEKDSWKKKRKILSKVFSFEFIAHKHEDIIKICSQSLRKNQMLAAQSGKFKDRKYVYDIMNFSGDFTSTVVTTCFLGGKSQSQTLDGMDIPTFLINLINDVNIQSTPLNLILGPNFLNLGLREKDREINRRIRIFQQWGTSYINDKIAEAKTALQDDPQKTPDNMIEALLANNIKHPDQHQYTTHDIMQQFKNFVLAGTDTTSHYIQVIIGFLSQNPETEQKLRKQIQVEMIDLDYSYDHLKRLKYLDAVEKQTTRMYGPVNFNFPRVVDKDHIIGGVKVYSGTMMKFNLMGVNYSEKYYKEPYKFRPERWLNGECENWDPYRLLGFGGGYRTCIGKHLALVQTKIAIVMLIQRYSSFKLLADRIQLKWKFLYVPQPFDIQFKLADNQAPAQ